MKCNLSDILLYLSFALYITVPKQNKNKNCFMTCILQTGLPWWLSSKESASRKYRFDPWVGKIPWRSKWQPTPVFLPEKSYGQKSLAGYSPWGRKELDTTEATEGQQQRTGEVVFYRSPSKTFLSEFWSKMDDYFDQLPLLNSTISVWTCKLPNGQPGWTWGCTCRLHAAVTSKMRMIKRRAWPLTFEASVNERFFDSCRKSTT